MSSQLKRRFWWAPAGLAAALLSGGLFAFHGNGPAPAPFTPSLAPAPLPARALAQAAPAGPCVSAALDPNVPHEVHQVGGATIQQAFDCFSWQSLVALNWPAAELKNGEPGTAKAFGERRADGRVVWTTFKQPHQIFLDQGQNPCQCDPKTPGCLEACWNQPDATAPAACQAGAGGGPALAATSKVGTVADRSQQAVPNVWLTDQSGQLARYEIRVDRDSFDYIVGNGFFNGNAQDALTAAFDFPTGADGGPLGAIELKAAWKILGPKDDPKRFFTEDATIVDTKADLATGRPDPRGGVYPTCNLPGEGPCCQRKMGLVGFHIAHKVKGRPQWVWSTFEQVDNAPIQGETPDPKAHYSFNDPTCAACVENQNPRLAGAPMTTPVQVARTTRVDIPLLPKDVNDQWHALVRGTVWENYVLVSTQWPAAPGAKKDPKPTPEVLSNTTMETYIQSADRRTASCMTCHSFASGLNGCPGDFSFLLGLAQPRPATHTRNCGP
jgi:hypothetical protein